jgi:hypothetical protein
VPKEGAVLRVMHGRRVLRAVRFGKLFGVVAVDTILGGKYKVG